MKTYKVLICLEQREEESDLDEGYWSKCVYQDVETIQLGDKFASEADGLDALLTYAQLCREHYIDHVLSK